MKKIKMIKKKKQMKIMRINEIILLSINYKNNFDKIKEFKF